MAGSSEMTESQAHEKGHEDRTSYEKYGRDNPLGEVLGPGSYHPPAGHKATYDRGWREEGRESGSTASGGAK